MNIIVVPYNRIHFYFRPDSSINRAWDDFYTPDFVTQIAAVPFAYVKICKAGKAVMKRFAGRYYDSPGYGIAIRADSLIDTTPASSCIANALDYSTYFSYDSKRPVTDVFTKNGVAIPIMPFPSKEEIEQSIEQVTSIASIRHGDILLFELHEGARLACGDRIGLGDSLFSVK